MPTPDLASLCPLLVGAAIVGTFWLIFNIRNTEKLVAHGDRELSLDAIDLEAEHRIWVHDNVGGTSDPVV